MITEKAYKDQPKYRCILHDIFDPTLAYRRRADELRSAGFTDDEILDELGGAPAPLSDESAIMRTVNYTFDPIHTYFAEGRFNTTSEAALYTAKTEATGYAERRHHWFVGKEAKSDYVIFSLRFSGRARDIRDEVTAGTLAFPDTFPICQSYATEARMRGFDGISAPSKRDTGGSCCAAFRADTVAPGRVVDIGQFR